MNKRERILAIGFGSVIGVWLLWTVIDSRLLQPIRQRDGQIAALESQVSSKMRELSDARDAASEITQWRHLALPGDPSLAQTLYLDYLRKTLAKAGIDRPALRPARAIRRGDDYTRLPVNIEARCQIGQLSELLRDFYSAPFLQQIRRLRVQPVVQDDQLQGFDVSLSVEGLSMADAFAKGRLPNPEDVAKVVGEPPARDPKEHELFAKKNSFQPTEIVAKSAEVKKEAVAQSVDERESFTLAATLSVNGVAEAWISKSGGEDKKVLHEGEKLEVGGLSAVVVKIEPNEVLLEVGEKVGPVRLGSSLASWKASEETASATPPQ